MEKALLKFLCAIPLTLSLLTVSACDQGGPAENVGAAIDRKAEQLKDAVDPPGPLEKVGRTIDKTVQ